MRGTRTRDSQSILPDQETQDVIQRHAPTIDSNEDAKEEFYSRLSTITENCPRQNIITMIGAFNAKYGSDNRGYEEITGQRGLGEMNDNGERFADLSALNNLECLPAQKDTYRNLGIT